METIAVIFEKLREANKHTDPEEKVKKLINQNGSGGWNGLHFAIYLAHQNVVKDLLERFEAAFNDDAIIVTIFLEVQM